MVGGFVVGVIEQATPLSTEIAKASAQHERMFWLSISVILLAAIATAAVTILVWRSGNRVQDAIRRETAQAQKDAALANERAGKLEVEAAQLRLKAAQAERELLELQLRTRPRQLDRNAFLKALAGQPKAPVQILYSRDDADSLEFAQEIENQLRRAGWTVTTREPIPTPSVPRSGPADDIPLPMTVGGQPSGVTVVARSISEEEAGAGRKRSMGRDDWVRTPWTVLLDAFGKSMGKSQGAGNIVSCPEGVLRIIVGPRP